MRPKKFLLVMPDYSDFPELFIRNLEKLGFQTSLITNKIPAYKYRGSERLVNFIRKTFLKDKSYKKKLIAQFEETEYSRIVDELDEKFDYIFVIRPDSFPVSFIEKLKDKTTKYIGYQWDGIEKFPKVKNYFSFFDTFFCFETVPGFSNVKKTTNFYFDFDNYKAAQTPVPNIPPVFYFVGLDWEIRRTKINNFVEFAVNNDFKLDFYLQEFEKNDDKNPHIKYITNRITFAQNIEFVKKSDVLVDFVDPRQVGLSFRFFEGMYYRKKIITDNMMVKNYDFYHPDNIFVIENDNNAVIQEFLNRPYQELPEQIVKKYSFSEWIFRMLRE